MAKGGPKEKTQEFMLNSFIELTKILKGLAHPNRFKILILLLNGPKNFQTLKNDMVLKKSALANHLSYLIDRSLVEKIQHGTYKLTTDGEDYLRAIETTYRESNTRRIKLDEARQREKLARSFIERR